VPEGGCRQTVGSLGLLLMDRQLIGRAAGLSGGDSPKLLLLLAGEDGAAATGARSS
jgi:hypothetical protein